VEPSNRVLPEKRGLSERELEEGDFVQKKKERRYVSETIDELGLSAEAAG
jgi:hypothetical protein